MNEILKIIRVSILNGGDCLSEGNREPRELGFCILFGIG